MAHRAMENGTLAVAKATKRMMLRIRKVAAWHGPRAIQELAKIMKTSNSDSVRVQAAIALLDRAYGKPAQAHHLSGPEGGPIQTAQFSPEEAARRIIYLLDQAEAASPLARLIQASQDGPGDEISTDPVLEHGQEMDASETVSNDNNEIDGEPEKLS